MTYTLFCVSVLFMVGEVSSISNDAIPTWVEKMADNWITFGIALGFSEEYLQSISDLNDNDVARCSAMMYHWLRTGDRREKTHERLLRAAKEATSGRCTEPLTYLGTVVHSMHVVYLYMCVDCCTDQALYVILCN